MKNLVSDEVANGRRHLLKTAWKAIKIHYHTLKDVGLKTNVKNDETPNCRWEAVSEVSLQLPALQEVGPKFLLSFAQNLPEE